MSRRARLAVTVALGCAAIAALAIFGFKSSGSSTKGSAAPDLPHEHLAGAAVTLARPGQERGWPSLAGRVLGELVRTLQIDEAPALERFSQSPEGRGRVVGVDWSDARSGARRSSTTTAGPSRTCATERDRRQRVRNRDLPTTFVLDASGHIRRMLRGPQTEASLRQALRARSKPPER